MVIRNSCFLIVLIVLMGSFVGCYQRTVAPALTFDQKNAETLDNEIKKMESDRQDLVQAIAKLKDSIAREAREVVTYGSTDDINIHS